MANYTDPILKYFFNKKIIMLSFIKNHLKVILLGLLPTIGMLTFLTNDQLIFRSNPASLLVLPIIETEYFQTVILDPTNMVGVPFIIIGANLLFWIPTALVINKIVTMRTKESAPQ